MMKYRECNGLKGFGFTVRVGGNTMPNSPSRTLAEKRDALRRAIESYGILGGKLGTHGQEFADTAAALRDILARGIEGEETT